MVISYGSIRLIKLPKNGFHVSCPWLWLRPRNFSSYLSLFGIRKSAPHPINRIFWCPFAPSQSPPHLQILLPLPFYHCKKVPYIISTHLPVFLSLFFPGQRYVCPLIANLLAFLTVLPAFSGFCLFFCMLPCSAL